MLLLLHRVYKLDYYQKNTFNNERISTLKSIILHCMVFVAYCSNTPSVTNSTAKLYLHLSRVL